MIVFVLCFVGCDYEPVHFCTLPATHFTIRLSGIPGCTLTGTPHVGCTLSYLVHLAWGVLDRMHFTSGAPLVPGLCSRASGFLADVICVNK